MIPQNKNPRSTNTPLGLWLIAAESSAFIRPIDRPFLVNMPWLYYLRCNRSDN